MINMPVVLPPPAEAFQILKKGEKEGKVRPQIEVAQKKEEIQPQAEFAEEVEFVRRLSALVQPLAAGPPKAVLEKLKATGHEFDKLRIALLQRMSRKGGQGALKKANEQTLELLREEGKKRLTPYGYRSLISALKSRLDLADAVFEAWDSGQIGKMEEVLRDSWESLIYADFCMTAVELVLMGEAPNWNPKTVTRLCHLAENYMSEVEDVFFAFALKERAKEKAKTTPLKEVERRLGLRS